MSTVRRPALELSDVFILDNVYLMHVIFQKLILPLSSGGFVPLYYLCLGRSWH
jgi:hypothetical protein